MKEQLISICGNKCTDCKACSSVCPIHCIMDKMNDDGRVELAIDTKRCIGCNKCKKVCPQLSEPEVNYPIHTYAAWSSDEKEKRISASGGIASATYRFAVENGWFFTGTYYDEKEYCVKMDIGSNLSDIEQFRNSKYAHSDASIVYQRCQKLAESGKNVIFIGLPCQVAAMRKVERRKENMGRIYYIDLVCHGTPPEKYLKEHIKAIEKELGEKAESCSFRDPSFDTSNFVFSLTSKMGKTYYAKKVVSDDCYQIGYHRAIIYRENCYSCNFARPERCGDLTLGDYKGLGLLAKYEGNRKNVSCVLVNTNQGKELIEKLIMGGYIEAYSRPVCEPIKCDHQLNAPSIPHKARNKFIHAYRKTGDFEEAAREVISIIAEKEILMEKLRVKQVKNFCKKFSPIYIYHAIERRLW